MSDRLKKLKELEAQLYEMLNEADVKSVAPIAKQYRETIKEIEEIEGTANINDEIEDILTERKADGKSGAVRKDRSKL